jgi:hypothetical protein
MATQAPTTSTSFPPELEALFEARGLPLLEEMKLLADLPQVRLTEKSFYDRAKPPGSKPQLRGVQFNLRCCTGPPVVQKCNELSDDRACPTHLEAARLVRAKVERDHGGELCRSRALAALAAEGSSGAAAEAQPANAFVINSTELRAVNFTMEELDSPVVQPRRGSRRAAVVSAPKPKRFRQHREVDGDIRGKCW